MGEGFTITIPLDADGTGDPRNAVADRRLWLDESRARLVEDGDPEARFLFCAAGQTITGRDAERYGYAPAAAASSSEPEDPPFDPDPEDPPGDPDPDAKGAPKAPDKQQPKAADKSRLPGQNKGR